MKLTKQQIDAVASKIYNAGALLSNFDSVVQEYFSGIININYNSLVNSTRKSYYYLELPPTYDFL